MKKHCNVCDWRTEHNERGECLICNPPKVPDRVLEAEGQDTLFPPPEAA